MMGRTWSFDSPWDLYAMSSFNTITSLSESPLVEGLVYAGTDDGFIQVTRGRRQELAAHRQAAGRAEPLFRQRHQGRPARPGHGLRRGRRSQERRLLALRAEERESRPQLEEHRRQPAGASCAVAHRAGSRETRAAVPRHRVRRVLYGQRRWRMDQAQRWRAEHSVPRPRHSDARERSRRRDFRSQLLRSRRLLAAAQCERRAC